MDNLLETIMDPKTRGEQIDSSVRFIIDDDAHYESLKHTPARVRESAVLIVKNGGINGYHESVIRAALNEYDTAGFIDPDSAPYTFD